MNKLSSNAEAFFELSMDNICILTKDGIFENMNPAFLKHLGYSGEELIKTPFINLVHSEDKQRTKELFLQLLTTPNLPIREFRNRIITKLGKIISLSWNLKSNDDSIIAIGKIITENISDNDFLNLLKKAASFTLTPVSVLKIESLSSLLKVEYINDSFTKLFGYSNAEMCGKSLNEFLQTTDETQVIEQVFECSKVEKPLNIMANFYAKNKEKVAVNLSTTVIKNNFTSSIYILIKYKDNRDSALIVEQLNTKNEQYQLVSEYLESATLTLNEKFEITFSTSYINELLGYDVEEVVNQNFLKFLNHNTIEDLKSLLAKSNELVLRTKMFKKNQEEIHVLLRLKKINEDKSSNLMYHVNIRDITSEINNVTLLNSKQELLDSVSEMTKTGGWSIDLRSGEITWTDETYKIHDLTKDEFDPTVGDAIDFYLPKHRPIVTQVVERCMRGVFYDIEAEILSNKGIVKQVRIMGKPSYNSFGEITRVFGTIQDITESNSNEAYKRMLESVVVNIEDAVLITNTDINNLKIIYANQAMTKLSGYSIEELLGKNPKILQGDKTSEEARKKIKDRLLKGESITTELLNYQKAGTPYWVEITISPIKSITGKIENFVAIQRDITKSKNRKRELENLVEQRTNELMIINKKLENFARIASHDMKTPLRSINSYLTLFTRSIGDKLTVKELEFLKQSQASVVDLNSLINSILAYSKIDDTHVEFKPMDVDYLIKHLVNKYFLNEAQEYGGTITYDKFPTKMIASNAQIRQVLQNLIGNAIKFRRENVAPIININYHEDADFHYISVKDNGTGIKTEYLEKIFEPFKRLVGKNIDGHGVGLSICKKIIETHGGDLTINSTPNEGSTFTASISKNLART